MGRGRLILIEGLDRTGKTTQTSILTDRLKPNAQLIKFPDRSTTIGKLINQYLTDKNFNLPNQSVHLLFSANRWEVAENIKETLLNGTNVILDRYVYSGIAYSAAKDVDGMDLQWCLNPDKGLLKPDLTLFLTNESNDDAERDGFGEERYENVQFQKKVKKQFYAAFKEFETPNSNTLKLVDVTNKSIEEVSEEIWKLVQPILSNKEENQEFSFF